MTRIEYLVAHPYEVEKSDIPLLKKEVEKYPYFYTLRALLLYGLKKENHPSFEDYLNKTSIHSSNRADLYHYINSEKLPDELIANEEIVETPIVEEELTENLINESTVEENTSIIETEHTENVDFVEQNIEHKSEEIFDLNPESESTIEEEDFVDEMIENDTEESELRTENVVEIISEDELNEVAEITNEVVESASIEPKIASEVDIENAILQTSSIEIIEQNSIETTSALNQNLPEKEIEIEATEEDQPEEILEGFSDNDEVIEENNPTEEETSDETTFSFSDWLKKVPSQSKDQKTIEEEQETAEREIKYKLIDDFLEKNPKIVPMKKTDITPAHPSTNFVQNTEEYSDLMTETLAQIYIEQKKYDKAIKAYKILILKYPEKNSLFANRIKEIENLKNSK